MLAIAMKETQPSPQNPSNDAQINWRTIWEQLNWDDKRAAASLQERLQRRAAQYAAIPADEADGVDDSYQVLTFTLGQEKYGIDVQHIFGIRALERLTRVPGAPPFYRGIVNVRGHITTVLDLRPLFDISIVPDEESPQELILVEAANLRLALLAHHIEGVASIPQTSMETLATVEYALGVTLERLIILDIERLFSDKRLWIGG
ncbi:MAG: hypothetical protein D6712_18485, partial [Chloroflexi bacterium]